MGCVPFNVPPENRERAGDFHRPYEGRVPFNRVLAEIRGFGRFSSPLRNSEIFNRPKTSGFHRGSDTGQGTYRIGTISKRN